MSRTKNHENFPIKEKHPRLDLGRLKVAGYIFLIWIVLLPPGWSSAQEVLDRIVAVVGNDIILESEFKFELSQYISQAGITFKNAEEQNKLQRDFLGQMIDNKLLLLAAQKDTTIQVTSKEVDAAVADQMKKVKAQFSEDAFQAQLQAEDLTENELKKKYREQIRNQMMIDRLVSTKLSKVSVSTKEVKDFYQSYEDSIPDQPEAVKLSHILLKIETSPATLDSLKRKAEGILQLVKKGQDFTQLAVIYSDDPSGKEGGDLGFFKRGDMIPQFEDVAFTLKPGEVSEVVQTEYGYHIIKVDERKDDRVHARHILILVRPSPEDTARVVHLADSLYQQLQQGADFGEMAKAYSTDEDSKKLGGELGWYPVASMTPEFKEAIKDLKIGEISPPVISQYGVHILKVLDRKTQRKLTLDEDWDAIKEMVRQKKTNEMIAKWADKLRQDYYVEVRL
ncbi:MAG: peptidylprolyl isomerase [Candidatus Zixiibacteriota bacterium]